MHRTSLDIYDDMPRAMKKYISNYGWHFNKAAYECAVNDMKSKDGSRPKVLTKEQVEEVLNSYNISSEEYIMYDHVFLASLCKAKYFGSSIQDEHHLALFIKDTLEEDDTIFRKWVATMIGNGKPIDWSELC